MTGPSLIDHSLPGALIFLIQSIVIFFAPGALITHLGCFNLKDLERICFYWVFGYFFAAFFYFACVRFHIESFFLPGVGLLNLGYWILFFRKDLKEWRKPWHPTRWWFIYGGWAVLMAVLIWVQADRWLSLGQEGLILGDDLYSDNLLGTVVAAEMKHSIPPENPFLAGENFLYHYFPYIPVTAFSKIFSTPFLPLTFFYLQILTRLLFFFTTLCVAYRLFQDPLTCLVAVITTVLIGAADFKIGFAMGFAYFFWGLLCYDEYLKSREKKWLAFCALLWGSLISSLTVMGLIVYATVLILPLLIWVRGHKSEMRPYLILAAAVIAAAILWLVISFGLPRSTPGHEPSIKLGMSMGSAIRDNIQDFSQDAYNFWLKQRDQIPKNPWAVASGEVKPMRYLFVGVIWLISVVTMMTQRLDYAVIGLWEAGKSIRNKNKKSHPALLFLAVAGWVGVLSPFVLKWREEDVASNYLVMSSVILLFLSAPLTVEILQKRGRWLAKILILIFLIHGLSYRALKRLPGLFVPYLYYTQTPVDLLDAYEFIKQNTNPEDAIFHPLAHETIFSTRAGEKPWAYPNHNYNLPIFTERRSLFIMSHDAQDITHNRIPGSGPEREADIKTFFETQNSHTALSILEKYGVRWILTTADKPLHFPMSERLQLAYENKIVKIYRYR